jgi:CMP/dCMP kinase
MRPRGIIIAIDGPTASGKSTTAKRVASALGYLHLNTGAMYRAVALLANEEGISETDERLSDILQQAEITFEDSGNVCLNGRNISEDIASPEIAIRASELSTIGFVREHLVERQRQIGREGGVVLEGRDIGTVVFPDAELKIFLVADPAARAERRQHEMEEHGRHIALEEMKTQLAERDKRDRERKLSPLKKADDAIEIDTTSLSIEEQVQKVIDLARKASK